MKEVVEKVKNGHRLSADEALALMQNAQPAELYSAANQVREYFLGKHVDTCSIMNARSGRCSENCKWCAQSAHNKTGCEVYDTVSSDAACEAAQKSKAAGIRRFSLVTSGRTLSETDVEKMCEAFEKIRKNSEIELCGSFGLLSQSALLRLKDAGMTRVHCNLETAPSKFVELCTTHSIDDKIATLQAARSVGMSLCSGGIIGMGETREQRVELAVTLSNLQVDSIPINILQPIKGTPLENTPPLPPEEILKTFAIFRLINPRAHIRFAGGRLAIKDVQKTALQAGVSSILMGDMLTTVGSGIADDFKMLDALGYEY